MPSAPTLTSPVSAALPPCRPISPAISALSSCCKTSSPFSHPSSPPTASFCRGDTLAHCECTASYPFPALYSSLLLASVRLACSPIHLGSSSRSAVYCLCNSSLPALSLLTNRAPCHRLLVFLFVLSLTGAIMANSYPPRLLLEHGLLCSASSRRDCAPEPAHFRL